MDKKIYNNIASLLSVNVLSYVTGFITFPYMTHVLGVGMFGLIGFAQSIATYLLLVVTYSFALTAPKDIAMASKKDIGRVFSAIECAKLFLLIISIIFILATLYFLPMDVMEKKVIAASILVPVGDVIFPIWFFQGIEKMKYITYATLVAKIITCILVFIFVKLPSDVIVAMVLQSITNIIAGLCSFLIIVMKYRYVLVIPSISDVVEQYKRGWRIFYSSLAVNLYTGSNVLFLGMFTNNTIVGYFVGAQKIMQPVKMIIDTIATAIYPRTSRMFIESKESTIKFLSKTLRKLVCVGFFLSFTVFFTADYIIDLVLGNGYDESKIVLKIIIWIPFIVAFTNIYLVQTLMVFGWQQSYSRIVMSSAIINLLIIGPCIYFGQDIGVSVAMLLTEVYVAIISWRVVSSKGIYFSMNE